MKRILTILVGLIASLALASVALATPGPRLNEHNISSKQCKPEGSHAKLVVDVRYVLLNDADSGVAGNAWANDTIRRHLRIWQRANDTFCVRVADHGSFVTYAGPSPGGASTVSAGIKGELEGGYISTDIVGTFTPTLPTQGNLGTFDLQCDTSFNCPGSAPSWKDYFTAPVGNEFVHWGWIYRAKQHHGSWLNQDDGNFGDITRIHQNSSAAKAA